MSSYTAGPWLVDKPIELDGGIRVTWTDESGFQWVVAYTRQCPGPSYEREEANASLISAAPDLLQALQDFLDTGFVGGPQLKRANDAIAKATGAPK